jgi:hypothetical protein
MVQRSAYKVIKRNGFSLSSLSTLAAFIIVFLLSIITITISYRDFQAGRSTIFRLAIFLCRALKPVEFSTFTLFIRLDITASHRYFALGNPFFLLLKK